MRSVLQAHPDAVKSAQNRAKALALRITGATYAEIAQELGISAATAHVYVNKGMNELNAESGELQREMRAMHVNRLEELIKGLWPKRTQPKIAAAIVRILDREAKLLGLDMPVKIQHIHNDVPEEPSRIDVKKLSLEQLIQLESILESGKPAERIEAPLQPKMIENGSQTPSASNSPARLQDSGYLLPRHEESEQGMGHSEAHVIERERIEPE